MKHLLWFTLPLALLSASPLAALAGEGGDDAAAARAYFETGAKEYEKENYPNAIRAFEQAYDLTHRPGLLFSIAQAHRRQYGLDAKAHNLRKALDYYQKYLVEDKSGKRRSEATAAVKDIQAMLERLPAEMQTGPSQEIDLPAQISITTQADDATISIDGAAPRALEPVDVPPGKYKVVVQAPGYFSEERDVTVKKGQIMAIDVQLRPMPARLSIQGRIGAEVRVDGTPRGTLPLAGPIEVEAGEHTLTVSMNGFHSFIEERSLGRGETVALNARIARTQQRIASFVLTGSGLFSAGVGIAALVLAEGARQEAENIDKDRRTISITTERLKKYKDYLELRSQLNIASTVTLNAGAGLGVLAFLLYYFDQPKLTPPRAKSDKKDEKRKDDSPVMRDMAFVPVASPGFVGFAFGGQF